MNRTLFIPGALLAACLLPWAAFGQSTGKPVEPLELELRFQRAAPADPTDVQVKFVGYQDTRCPGDVQCVWAGEARAIFWVTGTKVRPQVLTLPWTGGERSWGHAVRADGYEFLLLSLEPRPLASREVKPSEYKAVVAVRPYARGAASAGR